MKKAGFGLMVLVFAVVFGFVFLGCDTSTGGGGYVPQQQTPQTTKFEGTWKEKNMPRFGGGSMRLLPVISILLLVIMW